MGSTSEGAQAAYSIPVLFNIIHLYAREGDDRFNDDIQKINHEDIIIATQDGGVSAHLAEELFPDAKTFPIVRNSDPNLQLINVTTNKADIAILGASISQGYIKNNPKKVKIITKGNPVKTYQTTYMYSINDQALGNLINSALRQLQYEGTTERIIKRYIKEKEVIYIPQSSSRPLYE